MNIKHSIIVLAIISCALLASPAHTGKPAHAQEKESGASAVSTFTELLDYQPDIRFIHLQRFLETHNSPLAEYADSFVKEADANGLDWKLVTAIAGVESTFGKRIPSGSYNAWGWGIPTGAQSGIAFKDWGTGIQTVSRGLKTRYVDRGAVTIEQMGRIYAASPRWAGNVRFFIQRIEDFTKLSTIQTLEVTL